MKWHAEFNFIMVFFCWH